MKVYTAKTSALHQSSEQRNLQLFQTCINLMIKEFRSNIHTFSVEEFPPFVSRVFSLGCSRGATNSASHPVHTPFRETGLAGQAENSTILNTKHSFPGWYKFELQRQKYKNTPKHERAVQSYNGSICSPNHLNWIKMLSFQLTVIFR